MSERVADVSGRLLIVAAVVAAWLAIRNGTAAGPVELAVMLVPVVVYLVGLTGTSQTGRLAALACVLPFAVPPALLLVT